MAPLIKAPKAEAGIPSHVVVTGQHEAMLQQVATEEEIAAGLDYVREMEAIGRRRRSAA